MTEPRPEPPVSSAASRSGCICEVDPRRYGHQDDCPAGPRFGRVIDGLSQQDVVNLYLLARTVREVVQFDRGRLSGHGWEEMVEAYDVYWQERAHPFDDSELLGG